RSARPAAWVCLGGVPVTRDGGRLRVEGAGEVVEWAVKMERLPDDATLERRLERGAVGPELLEALARRVAAFHAGAEAGEHVAAFGRVDVGAGNAPEDFAPAPRHVGALGRRAGFDP